MDNMNGRCSGADASVPGEEQPAASRRRGELLENAILQAAWDELNEVGYAHLTMEGVAVRAKTNKTAVYRRWQRKSDLVIAALHKHVPKPADDIPNTGALRSDLLMVLGRITQTLQLIGAETIHGLMVEHMGGDFFAVPRLKHSEGKWNEMMMTILNNAEARGEISLEKITERIISLPIDLLRFEFLTTYAPISDHIVTEILDDIFLPLVIS